MKRQNRFNGLLCVLSLVAVCALALADTAQAASETWVGATNAWNDSGNWTGTNLPPISGDSLVFGAAGAGGVLLNNDLTSSSFNIAGITFNAGAGAYVIGDGTTAANAGNAFALTGNFISNSTSQETINTPFSMTAARTFQIASGCTVELAGNISGTGGGISKTQAGILILTGTNTYTGQTYLANFGGQTNVLRAYDGVGLPASSNLYIRVGVFETGVDLVRVGGSGAGQIQINGGVSGGPYPLGFSANGGAVRVCFGTLDLPTALTWNSGNFATNGTLILNYTTANNTLDFKNPVNLNGAARTVEVDAAAAYPATMSGVLSGTGTSGLTKTGVGTLVLSNTNTYAGVTTVSAGTLLTTKAAALPGYNSSARVVFSSGTLGVLMGDGSTTGWSTTQVDDLLTYATKTSGALGIDTSNGDLAQWTPFTTTNFGGALGLTKLGAGALTLDQANSYAGTTALKSGTLNVNNVGALGGGAFTISGGTTIDNTSTSAISSPTNSPPITLGGNFAFSTTAGTASNNLNLGNGAVTNAGNRTITLKGTDTVLTLGGTMTNTSNAVQTTTVNGAGNTLVLGGYALSNNATSRVDVIKGSGNVTITGAVTDGGTATASGLTYSGTGTLTLSGTNTYGGATTVSSGTLKVAGLINSSAVTVNGGTLMGGGGVKSIAVTSGTVAPGDGVGTLTAVGNVSMGTDSIYEWQLAGKTAGNYDKIAAGSINLTGTITFKIDNSLYSGSISSTDTFVVATSDTAINNSAIYNFGRPDGWTGGSLALSGDGLSLVLSGLSSSLLGDANGDGIVDAADYITVKRNFGAGPGAAGKEAIGDFNGDGNVDCADLQTLLANMGVGDSAPSTAPEPATLGLLAIGALAVIRRRRMA